MTDTVREIDWRRRAEDAESALAHARAENARLWELLHEIRAERRSTEYYRRLSEDLQASVSWKLTKPLRVGKVLGRAVKRRLGERSGG